MRDLAGATAVVTGGGSGIGLALVQAFATAGAHVVVADIDAASAEEAAAGAAALGVRSLPVVTDVSDAGSVEALADAAHGFSPAVHVLCNNAGVLLWGGARKATVADWRWVLDVNVMGVVHGLSAFLPGMLDQGEPAHIVNTASVAALRGSSEMTAYSASKNAVLAISEGLRAELTGTGIGVSVLCPANITSRILDAQRNRPRSAGPRAEEPMGTDPALGIDARHVAEATLAAIRDDDLYVFTYPGDWHEQLRASIEQRYEELVAALDRGGPDR